MTINSKSPLNDYLSDEHLSAIDLALIKELSQEVQNARNFYSQEHKSSAAPLDYYKQHDDEKSGEIILDEPPIAQSNVTASFVTEETNLEAINKLFVQDDDQENKIWTKVESDESRADPIAGILEYLITDEKYYNEECIEDFTIYGHDSDNSSTHTIYDLNDGWEDFEFDGIDYDEEAMHDDLTEVDVHNKLTRYQRASQHALSVGVDFNWDEDEINLLTEIFDRYGWNSCQHAIRRELIGGLLPSELFLAEQIRLIWHDYPEFSDFQLESGERAHRYHKLSWPSALALIRSFTAYPCIEEIEQLLIELYDRWSNSNNLIRRYPAFWRYVDHRSGRHTRYTPDTPWFYADPIDIDWNEYQGLDEIGYPNESKYRYSLLLLGVEIDKSESSKSNTGIINSMDDTNTIGDQVDIFNNSINKSEKECPLDSPDENEPRKPYTKRNKFTGRLALTSHPRPSAMGSPVTFTAFLLNVQASGVLQLMSGDSCLGTAQIEENRFSFRILNLTKGTHRIHAKYSDLIDGIILYSRPLRHVVK